MIFFRSTLRSVIGRLACQSNFPKMVFKIVMVRHGESEWNKENRFCGWFDAELSERGRIEIIINLFKYKVCRLSERRLHLISE